MDHVTSVPKPVTLYTLKLRTNHTPGALPLASLTSYLFMLAIGAGTSGFVYYYYSLPTVNSSFQLSWPIFQPIREAARTSFFLCVLVRGSRSLGCSSRFVYLNSVRT